MHRAYAAFCLLLASTLPVGAMTVDEAPIAQLVAESDAVVRGFVVAVEAELVPGARVRVRSRITIALADVERGPRELATTRRLTLTLPGGETATHATAVPGVPRLLPGDELVLLLTHRGGVWRPIGYHLGALFVSQDGSLWRAGAGGRPAVVLPRGAWDDALGALVPPRRDPRAPSVAP